MKNLIFVFSFVFSSALIMAQDGGCMEFFPKKPGATMISKSYDAANKLLNTMIYQIDKSYTYQSGEEIDITFTMTDANGKGIDRGSLNARCDDGVFYMNMTNRTLSPDVMKLLGSDTELVADFLDYPEFNVNSPASGSLEVTDASYTIRSKSNKKEQMSVRVYDRSYEKAEQLTTPAGTFMAAKVTFSFETTKDKKSTIYKGAEWYAPNAGIVRTETYDKNGKLQNYTVLTTLQNNK